MDELKELSDAQVDRIIRALEKGKYEATVESDWKKSRQIMISVEDVEGSPIGVFARFRLDGPTSSAVTGSEVHRILVCGFLFENTYNENGWGWGWDLLSDKYCMPEDSWLEDVLEDSKAYSPDPFEPAESVWDEYTMEEVLDIINDSICFENYVKIRGEYYGFSDELKDFLKEYFGHDEEILNNPDLKVVSADEIGNCLLSQGIFLLS